MAVANGLQRFLWTQPPVELEVPVPAELPDAEICTVLIAEQDDTLRGAMAMVLESDGFATLQATSGADALAILEAHRPDFVLLDLDLPALNGLGFFRLKAGDLRVASIPVIAITANPRAALPVGALGLLRKPFNLDEFLRVLDDHRAWASARLAQAAGRGAVA
jgi:two-component system cell cycle response regulator DivK